MEIKYFDIIFKMIRLNRKSGNNICHFYVNNIWHFTRQMRNFNKNMPHLSLFMVKKENRDLLEDFLLLLLLFIPNSITGKNNYYFLFISSIIFKNIIKFFKNPALNFNYLYKWQHYFNLSFQYNWIIKNSFLLFLTFFTRIRFKYF